MRLGAIADGLLLRLGAYAEALRHAGEPYYPDREAVKIDLRASLAYTEPETERAEAHLFAEWVDLRRSTTWYDDYRTYARWRIRRIAMAISDETFSRERAALLA